MLAELLAGLLTLVFGYVIGWLAAWVLVARATGSPSSKAWRRGLLAGIVALVMGQSTWALNYWRLSPLAAGLWLLLIFYLFTGLAQQQLVGRLTRRALFEFGGVVVGGVVVILRFAS